MTTFRFLVGGHLTSERVTFSPSQKGHKELSGRRKGALFQHPFDFEQKNPLHHGIMVDVFIYIFSTNSTPTSWFDLYPFLRVKTHPFQQLPFRVTGQHRDWKRSIKAFQKKSGMVRHEKIARNVHWLVVSTPLKNISQNGNLPQFSGWK